MGKIQNSQSGFSVVEGLLIVLVLAVIGFGGYFVWHSQKKTTDNSATSTTQTKSPTQPTTDQLIALAKQVYYVVDTPGSNPPTYINDCGKDYEGAGCPFTSQLFKNMATIKNKLGPGSGVPLLGGAQSGPTGTLTYSATPSAVGGTAQVVLTPDPTDGGNPTTWNLTITEVDGKLLVNNITIQMGPEVKPDSGMPACGPAEVYDLSC